MKAILGIKRGMTRVYNGDKAVAVTVVDTTDCVVSMKLEKGLELGIGKKRSNKALEGKYKTVGHVPAKTMSFQGDCDKNLADKLLASEFVDGDVITIMSESKGKGYAGAVKRYGFSGGPKTHGQSNKWRAPGSIGAGTSPGRVLKGKRMGGIMGNEMITLKKKTVVKVVDENTLLVSGPVPGSRGDVVLIYTEQ